MKKQEEKDVVVRTTIDNGGIILETLDKEIFIPTEILKGSNDGEGRVQSIFSCDVTNEPQYKDLMLFYRLSYTKITLLAILIFLSVTACAGFWFVGELSERYQEKLQRKQIK